MTNCVVFSAAKILTFKLAPLVLISTVSLAGCEKNEIADNPNSVLIICDTASNYSEMISKAEDIAEEASLEFDNNVFDPNAGSFISVLWSSAGQVNLISRDKAYVQVLLSFADFIEISDEERVSLERTFAEVKREIAVICER